ELGYSPHAYMSQRTSSPSSRQERMPRLARRRPFGRVRAERHRGPRPECGRLRQDRGMADGAERAEAGGHVFHERAYRLLVEVRLRKAIGNAAEIPEPAAGLRQRDADMPASPLALLSRQSHHGAERHQIAGGMVEHLRRQFLRALDAGGETLGMVETGRGLHQRIEAARPTDRHGHKPTASRKRCRAKFWPPLPARSRALPSPAADSLARRYRPWRAARTSAPCPLRS